MEKRIDIGSFLDSKDGCRGFEICRYQGEKPKIESVKGASRELVVKCDGGEVAAVGCGLSALSITLYRPGWFFRPKAMRRFCSVTVDGQDLDVLVPGGEEPIAEEETPAE